MNKESLLIFGGGPLQLSIINNAIDLGFYTIVIDPDENAVGRSIADKFIRVDGDDFDKTLCIAMDYKVKGVVTAATDKPLLMMARVARELSLKFPAFESILNTIDKSKFKDILIKNNLLCAKGKKYTSNNLPNAEDINFPVIIKPTNNSGSRGVMLCKTQMEFNKSVQETLNESKGEILIEEYIEGDEISVEALVFDKKVYILQITDKLTTKPPYNVEIGQIQPSKYKETYFAQIQEYLQKIIEVTGLNNCAIHPEFKINSNGIFLLEMGPRLGGDFMTSHLVPLSTGINMERALIRIATNKMIELQQTNNSAAMVKYFVFPVGEIIKNNLEVDKYYRKYPKLVLMESNLTKGDKIETIKNSLNRYGHYIIIGDDVDDLNELSNMIDKQLINELI